MGIYAAFGERQKVKSVLASRGFAPYPSDQGLYPWILDAFWGLQLPSAGTD